MASFDSSSSRESGSSLHSSFSRTEGRTSAKGSTAEANSPAIAVARATSPGSSEVPQNYIYDGTCIILYYLDTHTAGRSRPGHSRQDAANEILRSNTLFYLDQKSKQVKKRETKKVVDLMNDIVRNYCARSHTWDDLREQGSSIVSPKRLQDVDYQSYKERAADQPRTATEEPSELQAYLHGLSNSQLTIAESAHLPSVERPSYESLTPAALHAGRPWTPSFVLRSETATTQPQDMASEKMQEGYQPFLAKSGATRDDSDAQLPKSLYTPNDRQIVSSIHDFYEQQTSPLHDTSPHKTKPQPKRKSSTSLKLQPKRKTAKVASSETHVGGQPAHDAATELKPNRILQRRRIPIGTRNVVQHLVEVRTGRHKDQQWVNVDALTRMANSFDKKQGDLTVELERIDNVFGAAEGKGATAPLPDATGFHLNSESLSRAAADILLLTKSRIHQDLTARAAKGADEIVFSLRPSPNLKRMYSSIIGDATTSGSKKAAIVSSSSTEDIVVALVGSYLVSEVFRGSPWWLPSYDKFAASHNSTSQICDAILDEHKTNMDTVLRKAYYRRCHDQTWIETELHPLAQSLSEELATLIEQHLGCLKPSASTFTLAQRLFKILQQAIILKCKLSTARECVEYIWHSSGAKYDSYNMESANGEGEEVLLTSFPGVLLHHEDGVEVVYRAQVFVV